MKLGNPSSGESQPSEFRFARCSTVTLGRTLKSAAASIVNAPQQAGSSAGAEQGAAAAATAAARGRGSAAERSRAQLKGSAINLDQIPADLMSQIQSMIAQTSRGAAPARVQLNSDRDQRGYANF